MLGNFNKSIKLLKINTKKYLNISINLMSTLNRINVKLVQGTIIGLEEQLPNGGNFHIFHGVPYAKPPVGDLRFKSPLPLDKFPSDPLDCTEERDCCIHKDLMSQTIIGSEDCLFLNIYVPKTPNQKKKLPVMLWIHGGGLLQGSGTRALYSPEYIIQEGVIVITMNYRLGALGFLSFPEVGIPGNAGLKDMLLALKWVNQNIQEFGGDADNVTMFGESAGACAIQILALANNSKKYFHKAICQSGLGIMEWLWAVFPTEKARKLAHLTGCDSTKNDQEIYEHLRTAPAVDLLNKSYSTLDKYEKLQGLPMPFKIVVEKDSAEAIVTKHTVQALKDPNAISIPFLQGYNSHEGIVLIPNFEKKLADFEANLQYTLPRTLNVTPGSRIAQAVAKEVKELYFDDKPLSRERSLPGLANIFTDYYFLIPYMISTELQARYQKKHPVYLYRFSADGELNLYKKFFRTKLSGASHGDEMFYLFDMKLAGLQVSEESKAGKIRKNMCKMWTNFAKYGNPTPDALPIKWNPVKQLDSPAEKFNADFLDINDKLEMQINPENHRIEFWRNLFRKWNEDFIKPKF